MPPKGCDRERRAFRVVSEFSDRAGQRGSIAALRVAEKVHDSVRHAAANAGNHVPKAVPAAPRELSAALVTAAGANPRGVLRLLTEEGRERVKEAVDRGSGSDLGASAEGAHKTGRQDQKPLGGVSTSMTHF